MAFEAYHKGKYYVIFKRGFEECQKDLNVTIEKVFETDSLKIVLSDDDDPYFLCVLHVTRRDYEDLKKQQGLLIDFNNFPSQLVRLLQQCSSNNIYIVYRKDRENTRLKYKKDGGGLIVAISKRIKSKRCANWEDEREVIWLILEVSISEYFGSVYNQNEQNDNEKIFDETNISDVSADRKEQQTHTHIASTPGVPPASGDVKLVGGFLIMQQSNPLQYYFEVVEHNEFKRLVHLSLKTGPATDDDIKKHMADTINFLKKSLAAVKSSLSSSEALWNDKNIMFERKIQDLTLAISKMEEEKLRKETEFQEFLIHEKERLTQEKQQWQRNSEININIQLKNMQDIINKKEKQVDELNLVIKQQKDNIFQLENQLSDKSQRLNMLEKEVQKAHIEVATTKAKNTTLERELMEKERLCHQANLKCNDQEKTIRENLEIIKEQSSSLKILKKEKVCLEERLAICESLVNKNNQAANSTSEQLLKANQIIAKQNTDLIAMKDKILCRTAIALEQEKVIERNTKEIDDLKTEISTTKLNIEKLNAELNNLKEKYENSEKALKDREETIKNNNMVIQWLHKKLEENCVEDTQNRRKPVLMTAASSTPYFLTNKNNSDMLHGLSDESINFYGTKSDLEDSPRPDVQAKNKNTGLDPKYLQPVSDYRQPKESSRKGAEKTGASRQKENKNINLPKVDYREKKSAKGTYRLTPVSAYFP